MNGQQFGDYRIESPLAAGGIWELFRATDVQLNRQVALKVIPTNGAAAEQKRGTLHISAAVTEINRLIETLRGNLDEHARGAELIAARAEELGGGVGHSRGAADAVRRVIDGLRDSTRRLEADLSAFES